MSTAEAVKPAPAPVQPLGSFLGKLTPKPVEKSMEVKSESVTLAKTADAEKATGAKDAKAVRVEVDAVKADTKDATKESVAEVTKTDDKPKDDKTDKRLKDAQTWGNEEHKARLDAERKNAELQAQLVRIEAKLDGTYVESDAPSTEQLTADADVKGRIRASHHAAVRQYGEAFVMETVWSADSPYQELQSRSPRIRARVMEAEDPVLEAIAVVKEHQDGEKYGRTPEEIRKKMEAELAPKLKQDILDGLKTKPGPATNTLGDVRGGSERTEQKAEAPTRLDFRQVFPWGASRR